jgi:predicted Ser/Thr protein kinase
LSKVVLGETVPKGESLPTGPLPENAGGLSGAESPEDRETFAVAMDRPPLPESIGRYRVIRLLESGGQASVYQAAHPALPLDLAIKIAHRPSRIDHSLLKSDAAILCGLDHPNLVRVYDLDVHEGRPFVAMELVRGSNLKQKAEQSRPTARQAAAWVAEVARALNYVHIRNVVHQDIKPKNIMLDESGRPRLIDFGLARWRHIWSDDGRGPSGGTLAFKFPEQARGECHRVGATNDIFALGGVLYYLLTGPVPLGGATRDEQWRPARQCDIDRAALRAKKVPRRLERICLKALAADPAERFATAEEFRRALDRFLRRPAVILARVAGLLLLAPLAVWAVAGRGNVPRRGGTIYEAGTSLPLPVQTQQIIKVDRGGRAVLLKDAVPLVSGDKLWIECDLPVGWRASAFWLDSEGRVSELSPLSIKRLGQHDRLSYPPPKGPDNSVTLEGPPGTEMVLVCARRGAKVERGEIEALVPASAARMVLRGRSVLLFGTGQMALHVDGPVPTDAPAEPDDIRGLGTLQQSEARTAQECFQQIAESLRGRFDFVAGAVFPHRESRQD